MTGKPAKAGPNIFVLGRDGRAVFSAGSTWQALALRKNLLRLYLAWGAEAAFVTPSRSMAAFESKFLKTGQSANGPVPAGLQYALIVAILKEDARS
tara:strand:- start:3273 stop:3560 length:288 start_codon:yes stop_codon:yes gene_type:complete